MTKNQTKAFLLANAKEISNRLKSRTQGTKLRIHEKIYVDQTNTDGWYVEIGDVGRGQPKLEIWLDLFSGHSERKLSVFFYSSRANKIELLAETVEENLWPVRTILSDEMEQSEHLVLLKPIAKSEFNMPIIEYYEDKSCYFGIYDNTKTTVGKINQSFCKRAAAFFEDIIHALPLNSRTQEPSADYPRVENRATVALHLRRERSRLLSHDCKTRDNYQCRVCDLQMKDVYGDLGSQYAEAHHKVPLSTLSETVENTVNDLITVCPNCHSMLHRMEGKKGDFLRLRKIVLKNQKT